MTAAAALRQVMAFRCTRAPAEVIDSSLRRPELRVRRTTYRGIVVDERLLTRGFPNVAARGRAQVLVSLRGSAVLHVPERVVIAPGEAWLIPRTAIATARFEDAELFEVEWAGDASARRLSLDAAALRAAAEELEGVGRDGSSQRAYFGEVIELVQALGVELPRALGTLEGGPTERDLRLADAIAEQLANLKREATAPHLGDDAALSARQLQRVFEDFNARYGFNAKNWRDTRSRWRVQIAAVLLSVRALSIAEIADEVGFSSATALARAFARWKLDTPNALRAKVLADP